MRLKNETVEIGDTFSEWRKKVQEPTVHNRKKYTPEFKQTSVDRFLSGESASALAQELGIRRKFLYAWRDEGHGSNAVKKPKGKSVFKEDPQDAKIAKLEQQIADLQRLAGQQAAELDFFALALRATTESRPKKKVISVVECTPQSRI